MKQMKISAMVPGLVLARDVYDSSGIMVLNKGTKLSSEMINKLQNWGFIDVSVEEPSNSQIEEQEELVAPQISAAHDKAITITESILSSSDLKDVDPNLLRGMVGDIKNQIDLNTNVLLNLSHLKTYDYYLFSHVVNVSLLAMIIGKELKLEANELKDLGMAALLHDVGMVSIDRSIFDSTNRLTEDEWAEIKRHPDYGYDILKESENFPESVLLGTQQHHERIDGSGYPHGLKGQDIHLFGRIIAVADVYDACISPRKHRRRLTPHEALKNLLGESHLFDIKILKAFIASMAVYPIGSFVRLNTGEIAKVIGLNHSAPFRPEIRIMMDRLQQKLEKPVRINLLEDDYTQTYIEETLEREALDKVYRLLEE